MPEDQVFSGNESPIKKVEFGLGGIFFGLVLVSIVIFVLNYFNIINLPFNLPHQQEKQLFQANNSSQKTTQTLVGSQKISPVLEAKAVKAGYKIIWQGDESDSTGRTILASKDRARYSGYPDQFGYLNYQTAAIGIFKSFEKIPSGNDLYLILENPINKEQIKIRISTKVRSLDKIIAYFAVDNLNIVASKNTFSIEKLFDYSESEDDLQKIEKIVKQGDIIYAGLHVLLIADKGEIKNADITRDKNGAIYIDVVILRRFGGKEQIDKELEL